MDQTRDSWWCRGFLKTNAWASQVTRGLLWAAPLLPVCWYLGYGWELPLSIAIAHPVALPLSVYITKKTKQTKVKPWALSEFIRGSLMGLTYLTITLLK